MNKIAQIQPPEINTILDMLRWTSSQLNATEVFYGHGTDNYWDETLHLILPSLYLPINTPSIMYHAQLTIEERIRLIKLVRQRIIEHIPVPYLTKKAWFCGLEFYVDKRVFIPRSPIGELITSYLCNILPNISFRILDMCTGSGCIAISTAILYPKTEIDAVDISIDALTVAEYNIQLYNLENRVIPICSDLFDNISKLKYDLIIANPPYIKDSEICTLPKEFHHEPVLSLSAGNDALKIIHQILTNAVNYLNINGKLICEVGNAKMLLVKYYPYVPFHWFTFKNGGEGVFLLNYEQLLFFKKNQLDN